MKKSAFLAFAFISVSLMLAAQEKQDIVVKTDVSEVTVFIKGAQVVRKTTVNLPAGKSTVCFSKLSPYIDAKSVQVKADGEVMVLSVNHQLNYNDSVKQTGEREKYAKQLNELNEKIKLEQTEKEIINEELTFLRDNKKIGGNEGVDFTNLKATSTYYGERIHALKMKEIEVDRKIKALSEEKRDIERTIAVAGSVKPEPTGEIILTVDSKSALRIPVELSYYVNNAGWYPSYDIRAKNISEPVELVYKANIMQNTKEEWKNVRLKVSSANPNLGNVAPKLKSYLLNYYTKPPRYDENESSNQVRGKIMDETGPLPGASIIIKGTTIGTISDIDGNFSIAIPAGGGEIQISYIGYESKTLPVSNNFMNIVLEKDATELDEVVVVAYGTQKKESKSLSPSISTMRDVKDIKPKNVPLPVIQVENTTSVEFEIKTPYTILSENKNTTVEMEHYSLPAEYEYYCIPKVNRDAFLLANISDWEQYNLLEGEANIFFENTFVGKTILDVRYVSDTLNISLGRDKSVSVQRDKVKEYTTQKFLGSK
ncbi:MAG: mucoidy inhibitor MuiA family protein, partial [Tannerella sp.]|nr:mucoidy inhibitor MuiA family protein [Tannerella sp.]